MEKMEYEIKRLEDFYSLYKSSNKMDWVKDVILLWYEEKLTKLYTQQREQYE